MTRTGSVIGSLITSATSVIIALLLAFDVPLTEVQVAAIIGAAGFFGFVLTIVLYIVTLPRDKVLEYLVGTDQVVAGEANDQITPGDEVRVLAPRRALLEDTPTS